MNIKNLMVLQRVTRNPRLYVGGKKTLKTDEEKLPEMELFSKRIQLASIYGPYIPSIVLRALLSLSDCIKPYRMPIYIYFFFPYIRMNWGLEGVTAKFCCSYYLNTKDTQATETTHNSASKSSDYHIRLTEVRGKATERPVCKNDGKKAISGLSWPFLRLLNNERRKM